MFNVKEPPTTYRNDGWVGWNQFPGAMFYQGVELFRHGLSAFLIFQGLRDTCGFYRLWEGVFGGEVDLFWLVDVVHGSCDHVVLSCGWL